MSLQRGEIIRINLKSAILQAESSSAYLALNPTSGREQQGKARPCLVISNTKFNNRRKMVIVLPITNTIKPQIKTLVPLPDNISITGSVDTEQVRNLDLKDRWWKTTGVILDQDRTDYMVGMLTILLNC